MNDCGHCADGSVEDCPTHKSVDAVEAEMDIGLVDRGKYSPYGVIIRRYALTVQRLEAEAAALRAAGDQLAEAAENTNFDAENYDDTWQALKAWRELTKEESK